MIIIINYGMGNVASIANMLQKLGEECLITSKPEEIRQAKKIILPGVGSFDKGMQNLEEQGIIELLNTMVMENDIPILGICLGMQLFAKSSEEGKLLGLGWVDADVNRFDFSNLGENLKVPHMGWNIVKPVSNHFLFNKVAYPMRFYFAHSFHYVCHDKSNIIAISHYGYDFACSIEKNNILGVQFHPEKSHKYGMQVLKNFVENCF